MSFMINDKSAWKERLSKVQCYVLDMDGTFYLGDRLIDGSLSFIERVRESGKEFLFLTNNSSHNAEYYVEKLKRMGCMVEEKDIFTSGQATALYLNRVFPGARVFLLGNDYLKREMEKYHIDLVEENPDLVVIGFDTTLTYDKMAKVCDFIRYGVPYIATHPDFNCPTETGFIPDCGAILSFIKASTNKEPEIIVGKPNEEIVRGLLERTGLDKEKLAMVGDRLYTDIATGVNHGILSILVLSGETRKEDIGLSPVKPDMVFEKLWDIRPYLSDDMTGALGQRTEADNR